MAFVTSSNVESFCKPFGKIGVYPLLRYHSSFFNVRNTRTVSDSKLCEISSLIIESFLSVRFSLFTFLRPIVVFDETKFGETGIDSATLSTEFFDDGFHRRFYSCNSFLIARSTACIATDSRVPNSPMTIFFWRVAILSILMTESSFKPLRLDALIRTSNGYFFLGTPDVMNATIQSSPRETCRMSAGRTFWPERSVKGNGTRTILPLDIALLEVGDRIEIRLGRKKVETLRIGVHIRDVAE